jgi:hypothetical protein
MFTGVTASAQSNAAGEYSKHFRTSALAHLPISVAHAMPTEQ